jgi:hypothetical protein
MEDKVVETRKKAISIRMSTADVRRVKKLAQRLNVRDSDVIRFAVKGMLARLGPLYEPEAQGRNLVPVLVEAGAEFLRFFDLDANRLDTIINGDVEPEKRVAREDLALLALSGVQEPYAALKLSELNNTDERLLRSSDLSSSIRQYLYDKYIYRPGAERESASVSPAPLRFAMAAGGHHE